MTKPDIILIGGHAYRWQEICEIRRKQLETWKADQARQLALFELKNDCRPAAERTGARRYAEPTLFADMPESRNAAAAASPNHERKLAMNIQMIPLDALVPSPANVRKTGSKIGIDELASSIAAHGLLQNLQVRPIADDRYQVVAGKRRLAALKLLAKRKELAKDTAIGCNVLGSEDDTEISLAENEMREAMHPADQFEAFRQMIDDGRSVEDVARRFGATVLLVTQRLKLARVSPRLMKLYREQNLTLEQLMAFTVSDDHAAQEAAWFDAPDYDRSPRSIRRRLTDGHVSAADKRAVFVGLDAYREAGGQIVTDLFQSENEGYLTNPALLDQLCAARLESEAEAIRAEGWKWVEIMPEVSYESLRGYGRQHGKPQPMPAKQAKALARVEAKREVLAAKDELTDEEVEQLETLDAETAALAEVPVEWSERQKKRCGAVVGLGYHGELEVTRGLIAPADLKEPKRSGGEDQNGEGEALSGPAEPEASGLSKALRDDLIAQRTAALRAAVAANVPVALVALTQALALPLFYVGHPERPLDLRAISPHLRGESIEDNRGSKDMATRHAAWAERLPEEPDALWDWLIALDPVTLNELIAYCAAATVKPEGGAHVDRLAAAAGLDLAQWWTPTAKGYFSRVSKAQIAEAVTEGVTVQAAENIASLKKAEMAERAEALLAGTGWLPALLRR
jgi:ParB family transcriptional regulator, chromosome partitioning protein